MRRCEACCARLIKPCSARVDDHRPCWWVWFPLYFLVGLASDSWQVALVEQHDNHVAFFWPCNHALVWSTDFLSIDHCAINSLQKMKATDDPYPDVCPVHVFYRVPRLMTTGFLVLVSSSLEMRTYFVHHSHSMVLQSCTTSLWENYTVACRSILRKVLLCCIDEMRTLHIGNLIQVGRQTPVRFLTGI